MHRSTKPTTAAAGHPDHVPAPLRQTDLPLRGRRAAREPRTAVHRGRPDQDADVDRLRSRAGHRGGGPLRAGQGRPGSAGSRGHRRAARQPGRTRQHRAMNDRATQPAGFGADSRGCFEQVLAWLEGDEAAVMSHGELEGELDSRGRELLRRMLQDHLTLRAANEPRLAAVADDAGVVHAAVEAGHRRTLASVFGQVQVERLAYRHRGHQNLHPADAALNLPVERHSHGLRRLAAIESTRGSFEQAGAAITRASGQGVGKRQVEELTARTAIDVDDFYSIASHTEPAEDDVLVLSADGKGIVMRPDSLRPATAKAAAKASAKLATRLSKGEKRNRKRLAEVGAVYDLAPVPRGATDVLAAKRGEHPPPAAPTKPNDATPIIGAAGSRWSTATTTRSSAFKPKRAPEGSSFPSSST